MPRPASSFNGMLGDQDELARRPASFEVFVGLGRVLEGVGAADPDVEVALADPGEQALRAPEELLAGTRVMGERRAGDVEAALLVEDLWVEGRDLPARPAEEDHVAARIQAIQALVEGVPADGVVDHVHALAAGDAVRLLGEVLLPVEDHLVRPRLPVEPRLLLRAGGSPESRARPLARLA